MPQSHEVSFDGLTGPVTVVYDEEARTVTASAAGGPASVFVGVLEPPAAPEIVEPEPIVDAAPAGEAGDTE